MQTQFGMLRARQNNKYNVAAREFMQANMIELKIVHASEKCPPYCEDPRHIHGSHFVVTLAIGGKSVVFDYWGSYADKEFKLPPTRYDILSCIACEYHCPDSFDLFCGDFGYDNDSIRASEVFKRCKQFSDELKAVFSPELIKKWEDIENNLN